MAFDAPPGRTLETSGRANPVGCELGPVAYVATGAGIVRDATAVSSLTVRDRSTSTGMWAICMTLCVTLPSSRP